MISPAEELRAAITVLRCDHRFPLNRPAGSPDKPGICLMCGVHILDALEVPGALVEPLTAWLETEACEHEMPPCNDPTGMCNRCAWDPGTIFDALAVARAITGGTP